MIRRALLAIIGAINLAALAALILFGDPALAHARTFNVNTTVDGSDDSPGDGICRTATGKCSLRAAVEEANAAPSSDTIVLRAGRYPLTDLCLTASSPMTIVGAGAASTVIDGLSAVRAIDFDCGLLPPSTMTVSGVTFFNGVDYDTTGGLIWNSGGCTVKLNSVKVFGGAMTKGLGGCVANEAGSTMVITDSSISDCLAVSDTDAVRGGAIYNAGTMRIVNSTIRNSRAIATGANAAWGGGIFNDGGALSVVGSTINGNFAFSPGGSARGGGIASLGGTSVLVSNSTISGNQAKSTDVADTAEVFGGGLFFRDSLAVRVTRSKVTGNSVFSLMTNNFKAINARGGGIAADGTTAAAVRDGSVITGNTTNFASNGGIYRASPSNLTLDSSVGMRGNLPTNE